VDLPDGRQLNLGSVSVLRLVTDLVSSVVECRKALDAFLNKGSATLRVDLQALEGLLQPRRARWAGHGDPFIPAVSRQQFRGARMNPVQAIYTHMDEIESHVAALQQEAEQGQQDEQKTARLRQLTASLCRLVTLPEEGLTSKLASIEASLEAIGKTGFASREEVEALRALAASLSETVTGKTAAVDEDAKKELGIYMENESKLNRQKQDILKSILRKVKDGKYDPSSASKLWLYWVDEGAKMYVREFGGDVKDMFSKQLREGLAKDIANSEKKRIEEGEYDHLKIASDQSQSQQDQVQEKQAQDQGEQEKGEQDQEGQDKEASLRLSSLTINEALAHSVMAKVECALRVVEASERPGTQVAKKDLNTLSIKLSSLIEAADLTDPSICSEFAKLAQLADKVHSHFAA